MARLSTYESILRGCAAKGGVKVNQLLSDTSSLLYEYINAAYRKGREHDWWPETLKVELRYWRDGLWSAGTYPAGAIVYYATDEVYYENTSGGSTTETPSSTATDWAEAGTFNRYVSFEQNSGTNLATEETRIDAVKNIFQKDPRENPLSGPSAFVIVDDESGGEALAPKDFDFDKVYVQFRARQDDMSLMVEWDASTAYRVDDYVYYQSATSRGEAYKVIVATTAGDHPENTPASFQKVEIPYRLSEYIKCKALADWLSAGGGGTALGDTTSSIQLASYNEKRATEAIEDESYNLRGRSGQYGNYTKRIV
jgi:hypothetical protein